MARRIRRHGLRQNTVGHTAAGLWRHPDTRAPGALRDGIQTPTDDPLLLLSALAAVTDPRVVARTASP